jgi:pimeloyl-ACP methyl ester carboxylesterase
MMVVSGYDTDNTSDPLVELDTDARWQSLINELGPQGWDIVLFDYVDGAIDIKQNADNLARFIEVIDANATPNYHLALVGGSMGGIVTRTMFAQENSRMGTDTFVSVDAPHHGVYISNSLKDVADFLVNTVAGRQMAEHRSEFAVFYGWLRGLETATFKANNIAPMSTLAIAESDGRNPWQVSWGDRTIHTIYHPVCSYVYSDGLWSDYMPYHSTLMFDDTSVNSSGPSLGTKTYSYVSQVTSYFDQTQHNPQMEHGAPQVVIDQAKSFVLLHSPIKLAALSPPGALPFQLRVLSGAGRVCVIESSTNLTGWAPVFTNTVAASGFFDFTDTQSPGSDRRFFRAMSSPW